ncbi:hypothetical protein Salat_2942900 [Sesamum alatum]|uniref:RNase H type-1 domain-containing protein n=1 Tax=Sesamum alatum TaxID=300844 RepID=A0AAE1XJ89_9LAMI|nr:hypothetical protein Salat_2942900 [Sesamum alatum]
MTAVVVPCGLPLESAVGILHSRLAGNWCPSKIADMFWPVDHEAILSIPINQLGTEDIIDKPCSSNLLSLNRSGGALCGKPSFRIREEGEDTFHTLVTCHFARVVWGLSHFHSSVLLGRAPSILQWMASVSALMDARESSRFLCTCWTLWWCRNRKNADSAISFSQPGATSWEGPPLGSVKLNFDGALLDGGSAMGVEVVARNEKGECRAWRTKMVNKRGSGELAEALAAWEAIQLAASHGWTSIIMEGDCAVLVNKLRAASRDLSPVGTIIIDILRMADYFAFLSIYLC